MIVPARARGVRPTTLIIPSPGIAGASKQACTFRSGLHGEIGISPTLSSECPSVMSNSRWGSLTGGILLILIYLLLQSTAAEAAPGFAGIHRKYGCGRRNTVGSKPSFQISGEGITNDCAERRKLFAQDAPTPVDGDSSFPHLLNKALQFALRRPASGKTHEFHVLHRVVS